MAKEDKIGALWLSHSANEKAPFAKGEIEINGQKQRIVVWKNRFKDAENKPDYIIEKDTSTRSGQAVPASGWAKPAESKVDDMESIPFNGGTF